jgi:hypothetical protein
MKWLRVEPILFLLLVVVVGVAFRSRAFMDPGALWHVKIGDRILADGFMTTDPLTFTFAGKLWIPQQWLGECLMSLLHRVGGLDALLLGLAVVVAATFTAVGRRLHAGGMGWPLAIVVACSALVAAGFHFYVRPHMATIGFMAVTTMMLVDFDRRRIGPGRLALFIPLCLVWANIHGGMLGGVFSFGLVLAGWVALWAGNLDSAIHQRRTFFLVTAVLVVAAATMVVNPFGLEMQRTWFRIVGSAAMKELVPEHSALTLDRPGDMAVVGFFVAYVVTWLGAIRTRPRVTWFLPLVWFAYTLTSIRQGPLFVVTAVVVMADMWPHTLWHRVLSKAGDTLARNPDEPVPSVPWGLWAGVGVVLIGLLFVSRSTSFTRLPEEYVPVDLIDTLQDIERRVPAGTPFYNDLNFGGFTTYFAPRLKTFADDRFELCGDDWLRNYVDVIANRLDEFDTWQRMYGFRFALIATAEPSTPLEQHLQSDPRWRLVRSGKIASIYELVLD